MFKPVIKQKNIDLVSYATRAEGLVNMIKQNKTKHIEIHAQTHTHKHTHMLYVDLRPSQTCHSKVMHRKEVTHSEGSYGKKSRRRAWLTIWDKLIIPMYSHRLMHRKRVTCELHNSYFRSMTIKHAIPRTEEVTHPDGQLW